MSPPGCPLREVTCKIAPRGLGHIGFFLTLSCGHEQWAAHPVSVQIINGVEHRPCLQGPCYQRQRSMGTTE